MTPALSQITPFAHQAATSPDMVDGASTQQELVQRHIDPETETFGPGMKGAKRAKRRIPDAGGTRQAHRTF
jgi:hypothetical protein